MTLTRATLGKLGQRKTDVFTICGESVRLQKPTPLEFAQYQTGLINSKGEPDVTRFAESILLLTARMWIDADGVRLFSDKETKDLSVIDLDFYQALSEQCQRYAKPEVSSLVGESGQTTVSDSRVESVSNSE